MTIFIETDYVLLTAILWYIFVGLVASVPLLFVKDRGGI